ncbi:hypothetical protein NDI52_32780 [Leptolyngbya sp. PL-A3]|uniref:hypothetical protein n=1 Tax=Leptolyngbya sp. PL-A3 TaxID=2933911 RepID=UPI00329A5280
MTLAYIVTKDPSHAAILRQILPESSLRSVLFVSGESEYGAESMAQKLLLTERIPTILVMDAKTNDLSRLREQLQDLGFLLRQAAAKTPFKIAVAVPEIEAVFFQDRALVEEIAQRHFTDLEWQLAQHHPKELLENLPDFQGQFIEQALERAVGDRLQTLRQHPLIQDILSFLSSLTPGVVSTANP